MSHIVEKMKNIPTTCISDALNGLTNMDQVIKPVRDDLKVAGRAYTVKLRAADNEVVLKAIKEASPGDVLVIDAKGYVQNAACGDFVIGLARILGLAGVVIDGAVRDLGAIREMGFPVFCKGTTIAASDKHGTGKTNVPISCGNAVVRPGDIIVGDLDGVTVIPHEQEEEVLQRAIVKLEKDQEREKKALSSPEAALAYINQQLL
jgi:4-hydroxy-4-methyl-2-oxoglutarate aldolase